MANEFQCSYCKGDGTRCRCVIENGGGRAYVDTEKERKDLIRLNEIEIENLMRIESKD